MKNNSFGTGFVAFLIVVGFLFLVGSVGEACKPKCIEPGCINEQARDSSYCYLHKPYKYTPSHSSSS